METTINKTKKSTVSYSTVVTTINNIKAFVKVNEYHFKNEAALDLINEKTFLEAYNNLSMNKRKKLADFMASVNKYPTVGRINKFLHFFMKNIMKSEERVKITLSQKEIAIQEKRKAFKEAQAKFNEALAAYKAEKGDFYKLKLAKKAA